jgi:hypothetical protein
MLGRRSRVRQAEATAVLAAKGAAVLDFESFVDDIAFLSDRERARVKLAGSEVFDNILKHATPARGSRVVARAARRPGDEALVLGFYFRSPTFTTGAAKAAQAYCQPLFDHSSRRWRGIGIVMCRNLATSVAYRPGDSMDRIYLEFRS